MILKASERSGAVELGRHLLKTEENEHVEINEVSGFVSQTVLGAMKEIQAISMGTRCKKPLFSLSLSPPETESVRVEVFEHALDMIEERLGLKGQPRIVVFHEKEGRRHCHAVWSRIDADAMKAINISHWKTHLQQIGKQLFIENGWKLPEGFIDRTKRDPRNFTLTEWQAAKRAGENIREIKGLINECWASSDNRASFAKALEERGLFLARGDKGRHVAVSYSGEVYSISSVVGERKAVINARIGKPENLKSVQDIKGHIASAMSEKLSGYIREAKRIAANQMKPLLEKRAEMKIQHQQERKKFDTAINARHENEVRERAARVRHGWKGLWDKVRGEYSKVKAQNELEALFCLQRDRAQRHDLIQIQMRDRQTLQIDIRQAREREARQILTLYRDAARYRGIERGETSHIRDAFRGVAGTSERSAGNPLPSRERGLDLG